VNVVPILAAIVVHYQAIAAPVLVPAPSSQAGGGTKRTGTVPYVQYQATAAPVSVPNILEAPSTVPPIYPPRIVPRRRLHAALQQSWFFDVQWEAPGEVTAPDLAIVSDTQPRKRPYRASCYVIPPEFGVPTVVPVMSWTGHFADRHPRWAKRHHASRSQVLAWDTVLGPVVVTAPDLAVAGYPDRVHRIAKQRAYPQPSWPPFVADVTVIVPVAAWEPEYVERVRPRVSLLTAQQQAVAFWPLPVPAIAVSHLTGGRGYYVVPSHRREFPVPGRRRKFTVR
jgi:hypothetical protein